jgi:hypothetical protein
MKKTILLLTLSFVLTSCVSTIPLSANLDNQTLLLTENKDLKVEYNLRSQVKDGNIEYVSFKKNGKEISDGGIDVMYQSETAFKSIFKDYLNSKFNKYSENKILVDINLTNLRIEQRFLTSTFNMMGGDSKTNKKAICELTATIKYNGKVYKKDFKVTNTSYNETNSTVESDYFGRRTRSRESLSNPSLQKSKMLENAFNQAVIRFDNYITMIINKQ